MNIPLADKSREPKPQRGRDRGQVELAIGEEGSIYYLYDDLGRQIENRSTDESLDPASSGFDVAAVDFENNNAIQLRRIGSVERSNGDRAKRCSG